MSAPGWYPDPHGTGGHRYWDGSGWTGHLAPGPSGVVSPPDLGQGAQENVRDLDPRESRRGLRRVMLILAMLVVVGGLAFGLNVVLMPADMYSYSWAFDTQDSNIQVVLGSGNFEPVGEGDGATCRATVTVRDIAIGWVESDDIRQRGDLAPDGWEPADDEIAVGFAVEAGDAGELGGTDRNSSFSELVCVVDVGQVSFGGQSLPSGGTDSGRFWAASTCPNAMPLWHNDLYVGGDARGCAAATEVMKNFCVGETSSSTVCPEFNDVFKRWL